MGEDTLLTIRDNRTRVAVIGSRDFPEMSRVRQFVLTLNPREHIYVSGGCRGVDTVGEKAAKEKALTRIIIYPGWDHKGSALQRNKIIVDIADVVYAFWNGQSGGTKDGIEYSNKIGRVCHIIKSDGRGKD